MSRATFGIVVLTALLAFPTPSGRGEAPRKGDKLGDLMQQKLKASQAVLEGIALNDFEKIKKQADELLAISKRAEWKVIKTPKYELYSNDFQRIAENMGQNAKEKNLDAATLNYVELTLTCVKCHKHVRETRNTHADGPQY